MSLYSALYKICSNENIIILRNESEGAGMESGCRSVRSHCIDLHDHCTITLDSLFAYHVVTGLGCQG